MEPDSSVDSSAAHLELLAAIAWSLSEISNQDAGTLPSEGELTVFHASGQSAISILDYVMRIASFINCSFECYVVAVIFLDRLLTANPHIRFGPYTAHRLIITAVVLGVKSIDDEYYRNSFYAHVGGIPTHELNRMEVEFLVAMQYNLHVSEKEFAAYRNRLRWCMIEPSITAAAEGMTTQSPLSANPQGWGTGVISECDRNFGFPEPARLDDGSGADLVADEGCGEVPSPVAAAVSLIDSPTLRNFSPPPLNGAVTVVTSETTSRASVVEVSASAPALRHVVGAAAASQQQHSHHHHLHAHPHHSFAAFPTPSEAGAVPATASATAAPAWGGGTWPSWDSWDAPPPSADPWNSSPGDGGPPFDVPAELTVPFPDTAFAARAGGPAGRRSASGFVDDVVMRTGFGCGREPEPRSDWSLPGFGVLGVIAA